MSWSRGEPVRLETPRFILRSMRAADATPRYLGWLQDPEVNRYLNCRFEEHTLESLAGYIRSHDDRSRFLLGIFCKESGRHVGNLAASCALRDETAELGVMIGDRAYWGRGVVIEARGAVLDFLFQELGMYKVFGVTAAKNVPSLFNYRQQGYQREGVFRDQLLRDGERVDTVRFAIFRDDWLRR
jgi:RimJ/RimL family protein N-acetyltransferase